MFRVPSKVLFCTSFIIGLVAAASFTNPIGADLGTTYNLGQQINIAWQGAENFTALSLGLRQSSTTNIYWIIGSPEASPSGYTASSYLWSIALGNGESLSKGNEFSFWLIDGGYNVQVYSSAFYLRDPSASSTTALTTKSTSSSAPTTISQPSSKPTTTGASATGTNSTPTSTTSAPSDTSSGISTGAIVGIVVGVLAAFGLGLGAAYLLLRRRGRSNTGGAAALPGPTHGQHNEMKDYQAVSTDQYGYYPRRELAGDNPQRELPGDQPQFGAQQPYRAVHEAP